MPHVKRKSIESDINVFIQLTTYLGYGLLTVLGIARDWIDLFMGWKAPTPKGYAPITRDFEEFYRRRHYGRIVDAFNRPITGPASGIIKCILREPPKNGECHLPTETKEALKNNHELKPSQYRECLNLSSYNYLGFGQPGHPLCEKNVINAVNDYGLSTTTAPAYGGNTEIHRKLEKVVADFLSVEDSMVFGMGWGVNATAIPALVGKGSLIISDSINHNSIVTGARASGAKIATFPHDDMKALERIIRKFIIEGQPRTHRPWKKILIIVEGVYSMEGEICDLKSIVEIKKKYKCYLYLDEAHSIGAVGKTGRGACEYNGVDTKDVDILMGTFTKSFGAIGGYIAGKKSLVDAVRATCASQIFSAGLSPPCVAQILSAFEVIDSDEGESRIKQLHDNSDLMRKELNDAGLYVIGDYGSAVIPMLLCHPGKIGYTSKLLLERGIACVSVGFPAVPILFARIRFCISANHTKQQILNAVQKIKKVADITHLYYQKKWMVVGQTKKTLSSEGLITISTNSTTQQKLTMHNTSNPKFIIKEIDGKGKGMIALQNIKQGEKIYAEKPLMTINRNNASAKQIKNNFDELSDENKRIFLDLAYQSHVKSKHDIFRTNSIMNTFGNETVSHLFPTICRVNHSCCANAHWTWNNTLKQEELICVFNIKCGQEITTNYLGMNTMLTHNIRTQLLTKNWGFQCKCNWCTKNHHDIKSLDASISRRQILKQKSQKLSEQCYNFAIEAIKLVKEKFDHHPLYLFDHHFDALKCCIRSEKQDFKKQIQFHKAETLKNYAIFMGNSRLELPYNIKCWIQ